MTGKSGKNIPNFKESTKIIFVDSGDIIENFKEKIVTPNSKIISFDYESHKKLNEYEIEHVVSDVFLDVEISKEITKKNYELIKWYELPIVKEKLTFRNVNIAKLLRDELISNLLKVIKKIFEIKIIAKKFPNAEFYASGIMLEIIKKFSNQTKLLSKEKKNESYYFDKVQTSFNIAGKKIDLHISNKKYQKIKNSFEKIYNFTSTNTKNLDEFVLMVELNTEYFENLFLKSKENQINFAYYGRRRPAIWNKKSLDIIKKSNCNIISSGELTYNYISSEIKENSKKILNAFEEISLDESLYDFFYLQNFSIWPLVKIKIAELLESRIENIVEEILLAYNLFEKFNPRVIIIISEAGRTEQIISTLAYHKKIPILHLQEGLHWDTIEAYQNTSSQGVYPELATEFHVWGEIYEKDAIIVGNVESSKVKVIGSPRFEITNYNESENSEEFVLLATMPPQEEEIEGINVKNLEKYRKSIFEICEVIDKLGKKLKIKLHPSTDILNLSEEIKDKYYKVEVIHQGDIEPLIRKSSEVIVTGMSTVILQAQILKKPVISIPLIEYNWKQPSIFRSKSCIVSNLDQLENILKKISENKDFRKELIQEGENFILKCLTNRGNVSQKFCEHVKKMLN